MKIAIPINGESVNPHFGRSEAFSIITVDGHKILTIETLSTADLQHNHGGLASLLAANGVSLVIAGGMGPGMYNTLKTQGMEVIRGASGKIVNVLTQYFEGKLISTDVHCEHHGHSEHSHP